MLRPRPCSIALLGVAALACGPAGLPASGSADTSTDEAVGPTETEVGGGILPKLDAQESCDVWQQDCPAGEKCVSYYDGDGEWGYQFKCVPVLGDRGPGESCTSTGYAEATDDCDASSYCLPFGQDGVGVCYEFCGGNPDTPDCPPKSTCEWYVFVCTPICDPLAQDCPPGTACYWEGVGFECVITTEDIPVGQPCGYINDCAAGLLCTDGVLVPDCAGSACCTPFCSLELGDPGCSALPGTICVAFFEAGAAPPGYEDVGVCVLP